MTLEFRVTGANGRLRSVAQALKEAGDTGLQRELRRGVVRATRPAIAAVRRELPAYMPSGYLPTFRSSLKLRTGDISGGVRITADAQGKTEPRRVTDLNRGRLRHPLWGNRDRWYAQRIRPRFVDEPIQQQAPAMRAELERSLDTVAAKIRGA